MYSDEEVQAFLKTRVARPSSAGVILEDEKGRALILKANYKQYWSFPGGWVEDTQTPIQAAHRELEEETGLVRRVEDLEFAYVVYRSSQLMNTYQFIFRSTVMHDESEAIELQPEEIDEYRFVEKSDVLAQPDEYGEAVIIWARSSPGGYFEQQLQA